MVALYMIRRVTFRYFIPVAAKTDKLIENACDSIMTDGIIRNTKPAADDPFAVQILHGTPSTAASTARSEPLLPPGKNVYFDNV